MNGQNDKLTHIPIGRYRMVLTAMVIIFICYNFTVYTSVGENPLPPLSEQAMRGEVLWQQNNCTSCHQLYGLGGYLGPDLTNVISREGRGPDYVKAMLNSGIKAMPQFDFSENEKEDIVAFLTHIDQTGYFPNAAADIQKSGWVELKYKNLINAKDE